MAVCAVLFAAIGCAGRDGNVNDPPVGGEEQGMYLTICERRVSVTMAQNAAARALTERVARQGKVVYTAEDYGGFEKVGALGFLLPADDVPITTQPGDIMLYEGDRLVLFYGSNRWSYTPIGRIEGLSQVALAELCRAGQGSVQVTLEPA